MPGFDRTGPMGQGPMTGGARGLCTSGSTALPAPPYGGYRRGLRPGRGRGFGRGYGFRSFRWEGYPPEFGFMPAADPQSELAMLRQQADYLKRQLEAITARIDHIEADADKSQS